MNKNQYCLLFFFNNKQLIFQISFFFWSYLCSLYVYAPSYCCSWQDSLNHDLNRYCLDNEVIIVHRWNKITKLLRILSIPLSWTSYPRAHRTASSRPTGCTCSCSCSCNCKGSSRNFRNLCCTRQISPNRPRYRKQDRTRGDIGWPSLAESTWTFVSGPQKPKSLSFLHHLQIL